MQPHVKPTQLLSVTFIVSHIEDHQRYQGHNTYHIDIFIKLDTFPCMVDILALDPKCDLH